MFTTSSKYFLGIGLLTGIAIAVSLFSVNPSALAVTALIGLFGAVGLLAGVMLSVRDGDVTSGDSSASSHPAPTTSMWPLLTAGGAALLLIGTITQPIIFLLGIVVLLAAFVEWTVLAWSEGASSDDEFNAAARKRLLNPIEFPVLGAVGLGLLIFSFSRVMLAVDSRMGVALFIVIGALVLVGGVLFAARTTLRQSVVSAICVLAAIAIVAAGFSAARSGMRIELEVAKYESDHEVPRNCGAKATAHGDSGVMQTISAIGGANATVEFIGGKLVAHVQGIQGEQRVITISRSAPTSFIFRNFDPGRFRLVAHLGTRKVTEGVVEEVVVCTQLIKSGAEQLLTLSVPKSSVANGPYSLSVAGVDGQVIELIVP
jgi:hypothetical protein